MKQDFRHGKGLSFSILGGQSVTAKDRQGILDFNTQLKNGVKPAKAWATTMANCSIAAQNQTRQCLKAKGSLTELANGLKTTSVASKAAAIGMKALSIAGNMFVSMAIFKGIELLVSLIDNYANRIKYAQERLDEFSNTISESKNNLATQEEWIKEHGKRYEELSRGVDNYGHAVSLTSDEISEYNSLTKDIESMFPTMVTGYNDQNQAIIKMKGSVDALTESYKENVEVAYATTLAKSGEYFGDYKTGIADAESAKKTIETLLNADTITGFSKRNGGFQFKIGDNYYADDIKKMLDCWTAN